MARRSYCLLTLLLLGMAGCESGGDLSSNPPVATQAATQAPGPPAPPGPPGDASAPAADPGSKLPPPSKEAPPGATIRDGLVELDHPTAEKWNGDTDAAYWKQRQDTGQGPQLAPVLEVTGVLTELLPAPRVGSDTHSFEGVYAMVKVDSLVQPVQCHFMIVSPDHKLTRLIGQNITARGFALSYSPSSLPRDGRLELSQCRLAAQ